MIRPTQKLKQSLALRMTKGFTPKGFVDGLALYGSLEALFNEKAGKDFDWKEVDQEIERCAKAGVDIVTYLDELYPALLREIFDPPIVLYVKGALPDAMETTVAMVGSRAATTHGLEMADTLAQELAGAKAVVVSGLALGIDTASHQGALKAKGKTLAVLGFGLGHMYPSENKKLAREIVEKGGALITEFPFETSPRPQYFPLRNRIISGLSRAVVVVEARDKSGALITADLALEQGRDVYAVPGNAASKKSLGSNVLLRQGARLITSADDLLEDLGLQKPGAAAKKEKKRAQLTPEERRLLGILETSESLHLDELIEQSKLPVSAALQHLTTLAIKGVVRELPGKYFTEVHS